MARRYGRAASETPPPGNPNLAALATWLLPGAGHLMIGQATVGLVAFCVVQGLWILGHFLTGGMLLEYLQPELRTQFAIALTPEMGNLGAALWHMFNDPYGPNGLPRPWPSTMTLGVWMTALSGVANVALCVRAYADAAFPKERLAKGVHPGTAVFLGWLVPGLGHWVQGRKLRGTLVFAMLVGLLIVGTWLAAGANLDREQHFYYWSGQFMVGGPAILFEMLFGGSRIRAEIPYVDAGLVFGCLAGLLNILAMMDAYTTAEVRLTATAEAPVTDDFKTPEQAGVGA